MEGQAIALGSKLESEKHGLDDQEEIVKVPQGKGGKSKRYLYLLLVIIAIVAISAIIAVIGLAIALGVQSSQSQSISQTSDPDTCTTPGCIRLAAQISSAMNQSVDPCEDFYEFTCGNWGQRNPIPPLTEQQATNTLSTAQYRIYRYLADLGAGVYRDSNLNIKYAMYKSSTENAFDLYRSCMNSSGIERLGAKPLLDVIRNTLGGWPLIGIPAETSPWSLNSTDFFYEKTHGSVAFFRVLQAWQLNLVTQSQSRSRYAIYLGQQDSTPIQKYSLTIVNTVLSYLNESLGGSVHASAEDIQNIIDLDQRLLNISIPDPTTVYNESDYVYTIERLQTLCPVFDWEGFVHYMYDISGLDIPQDLQIIVATPAYFERLGPLLESTDPEVIRNYAKLMFVFEHLQNLDSYARGLASIYETTDSETPTPGDYFSCIKYVQRTLPIALAIPFVENVIPEEIKEKITMMVEYIKKAFGERVNQMDWLSDFSKKSSIEKLNAIIAYSAYPAEINNYASELYTRFYAGSSEYFANRLREYELTLRLELNLTHGYNKAVWTYEAAPTEVNAFYDPRTNTIAILAAIATEPMYSADWPDYQLFGALGMIVGHEITHGFDNDGQQYDKDGIQRMMWSNESQEEFNNRLQCFVDQYNQYSVMGFQVNGARTLAENIADSGGLLTSFRAYRMRAETVSQLKLPTLPYTPEQLFFIAFGQTWCESVGNPYYYDEFDDEQAVHSPNPARIRAVANSPEFAEAFNCPAGTAMNPTNKCTIW